jgi:hypothetical protein
MPFKLPRPVEGDFGIVDEKAIGLARVGPCTEFGMQDGQYRTTSISRKTWMHSTKDMHLPA